MTEGSVLVSSQKAIRLPRGLKILVIDADPTSRFRLKSTLRGMAEVDSVAEASSPKGMIDLMSNQAINIVMIDQYTDEDEVYDIVKDAREQPQGAKARWILVSEALDEETVTRGREVGFRGFLPKPFDIRGLEKALMNAVGQPAEGKASKAQEQLRETLKKLRQVSLFSGFTDQELVTMLKICRMRNIAAGTYVFHEGEPGYNLYVVVTGKIDIKKTINNQARTLVSMDPGDCFGEMAIISDEPRFADAVAASTCTLIEINEKVINSNEDMLSLKLVRQIAILLARKLRSR